MGYVTSQKNGASALGLQRVLGLGSYETAWTWLHKFRRAMVRPDRDRQRGWIEVDETFIGGLAEGAVGGRPKTNKALVVIAAQADGPGIGRIRMRMIGDASADSLHPFNVFEKRLSRGHKTTVPARFAFPLSICFRTFRAAFRSNRPFAAQRRPMKRGILSGSAFGFSSAGT
jgi:hypothetical protein